MADQTSNTSTDVQQDAQTPGPVQMAEATPEASEAAQQAHSTDEQAQDETEDQPGEDSQGRSKAQKNAQEAKKYRQQLRETQAALDTANARVDALQGAEIERMAASMQIRKPTAVWAGGLDLAAVRDEAGNVDSEKARAAIEKVQDDLGLAVHGEWAIDPVQAATDSGDYDSRYFDREWEDAFGF